MTATLLLSVPARERARAAEAEVPIRLQVALLGRVLPYDRNFAARASRGLRVLLVVKAGDADSERIGAQLAAELRALGSLAQHAHRADVIRFSTDAELAARVRSDGASIVYFSSGLSAELPRVARSLVGVDVLSVAAMGDDVRRGAVLGFVASSGKPKLTVNLAQARAQHVDFRADFLKLARVVTP